MYHLELISEYGEFSTADRAKRCFNYYDDVYLNDYDREIEEYDTRYPLFEIAHAMKDSSSSARAVRAAPKKRKNIRDDDVRPTVNPALTAVALLLASSYLLQKAFHQSYLPKSKL